LVVATVFSLASVADFTVSGVVVCSFAFGASTIE